jgi:hypothetical protein
MGLSFREDLLSAVGWIEFSSVCNIGGSYGPLALLLMGYRGWSIG